MDSGESLQRDDIVSKIKLQINNNKIIDKSLVTSQPVDINLDSFETIPNGRVRFVIKKAIFDCFFYKGSKKLLVFFPYARGVPGKTYQNIPHFNRWSYYKFTGYSVLCVEDPMYYDYPSLALGWMWGDQDRNYREIFADIVKKIVKYCGVDGDSVIFFGSSGGGAPAIHTAAICGFGSVISINSQINFEYERYNRKLSQFIKCTGIDVTANDKYSRNRLDLIMQSATNNKFLIVTNLDSDWDRVDHLGYLSKKLGIVPCYGFLQFNNIFFWSYYTDNKYVKHSAQEDHSLFWALDYLLDILSSETYDFQKCKKYVSLFNNFWYDKYKDSELLQSVKEDFNNSLMDKRTARIDLLNVYSFSSDSKIMSDQNYINCSDPEAVILAPSWLKNQSYQGFVIQSEVGYIEINFTPKKNIEYEIWLRGIDKKINGVRVPVWVDYTLLSVNDTYINYDVIKACHDVPYRKSFVCLKNSPCVIRIAWRMHVDT